MIIRKDAVFNIINAIASIFSKDMAIDLGTANTLVSVKGEGIVFSEPSVVAIRRGDRSGREALAVGNVAKEMVGMTPDSIVAIRPLKNGVIADFDVTEKMIEHFIRRVYNRRPVLARPRIVISVPYGITAVERRAVRNSCERAGARHAHLVYEPMAAGIGAGLPIFEPTASMMIDIGGGTSEIAIISLGSIVLCESIRVAGDEMDEAIIKHMRQAYNLLIGERTAERIKIQIGSAYPMEEEKTMEVKGRDLIAGLPRSTTVNSEEIREALSEPLGQIINTIKLALERTPPELAGDLLEKGMYLSGGSTLLRGFDKVIAAETGIPVFYTEDPLTVVARGTYQILEDYERLQLFRLLDTANDD